MSEIRDQQAADRRAYESPGLVRYGRIEDLTHGINQTTTNIVDVLSLQS